MNKCHICPEFISPRYKHHKCPHKWVVLISYEDGWSELSDPSWVTEYTIFAFSPEQAALKAVAKDERSGVDYSVASGINIAHVKVTSENQPKTINEPQYFSVSGYISNEYIATAANPTEKELTPPKEQHD